jgi:hypothetical protein
MVGLFLSLYLVILSYHFVLPQVLPLLLFLHFAAVGQHEGYFIYGLS